MQAVLSNLIGSEQNFTVEDGIIQDNIHLARLIIEQNLHLAALINLDRSNAFDRVYYRFLAALLAT